MTLILLVILAALVFTYINGFHDTANSIATVVATKVLTPRQAVMLAAVTNLVGAFFGTAVATTIASGLVDPKVATSEVLICALVAAIRLEPADVVVRHAVQFVARARRRIVRRVPGRRAQQLARPRLVRSQPRALVEEQRPALEGRRADDLLAHLRIGVRLSVHGPALFSVAQLAAGHASTGPSANCSSSVRLTWVSATAPTTRKKPWASSRWRLLTGTSSGVFDHLPGWLSFSAHRRTGGRQPLAIAAWIKVLCALTMCAGTAVGGWRIIKTLGHKMVRLHPVHGFAAETTAATILVTAAHFGMPVSTTHAVTTSIMGVGCAKGFNHLKFDVVERIIWAWIMTLPASGGVAYLLVKLAQVAGWIP